MIVDHELLNRVEDAIAAERSALIEARLAVAIHAGCELAVITADPGSSSGRNAERAGFQLVCNHAGMQAAGG